MLPRALGIPCRIRQFLPRALGKKKPALSPAPVFANLVLPGVV
jgi:hypothetical protein